MVDEFRDRLRKAIDSADWEKIESLCIENPGDFFSSLDVRKMGKKRLSTLNTIALVSLSKRKNIQYVALERLIIEQIKLSTKTKEETTVKPQTSLEAYRASFQK